MNLALAELSTLLALPDPEAAEALSERIAVLDEIDRVHKLSFSERGRIAIEFENRRLWTHLTDPKTGQRFRSWTAWVHSGSIGCASTTFAAKKLMRRLSDVPPERLTGIPTATLYEMVSLSTATRNDPDVQAAARALPTNTFLQKLAKDHPNQHKEPTETLRFSPVISGAKIVREWVEWALEHDLAGNQAEAIVMACEAALRDARAEVPEDVPQECA